MRLMSQILVFLLVPVIKLFANSASILLIITDTYVMWTIIIGSDTLMSMIRRSDCI